MVLFTCGKNEAKVNKLPSITYQKTFLHKSYIRNYRSIPTINPFTKEVCPDIRMLHETNEGSKNYGDYEEVFLCPQFIMLRIYRILASLKVTFTPSPFPFCTALGYFPSGFVDHAPQTGEDLLNLLVTINDIDLALSPQHMLEDQTTGQWQEYGILERLKLDSFVYRTIVVKKVTRILEYVLWVYTPCYTFYTRPICDSTLPKVYSWWYVYSKRREMQEKYRHNTLQEMIEELEQIVLILHHRLKTGLFGSSDEVEKADGKFEKTQDNRFFCGKLLTILDVVVYSLLSVLLDIPIQLTPWGFLYGNELLPSIVQDSVIQPNIQKSAQVEKGLGFWDNCSLLSQSFFLGRNRSDESQNEKVRDVKIALTRLKTFLFDFDDEVWHTFKRQWKIFQRDPMDTKYLEMPPEKI